MVATVGTVATSDKIKLIAIGVRHERRYVRIRAMEPRTHQLRRLHFIRLQLLQATHSPRLAIVQCVQRIFGGAVCRDVWFPAHDLFLVRLAAKPVSERGLVLARCRSSARDGVCLLYTSDAADDLT